MTKNNPQITFTDRLASKKLFFPAVYGCLFLLILVSLFLGQYPVSVSSVFDILFSLARGESSGNVDQSVIVYVRLPRIILACIVGGTLATCGAAFQGLFRNPLVSSGMLGVSSGAGFGAALALILFNSFIYVYFFSFFFALSAVALCLVIGRYCSSQQSIILVLGGVIVGAVYSSLTSFLKYVADPYDELPAIVFWLMGSLSRADYSQICFAGIPMLLGIGGVFIIRWRLNVLAMGDREAQSLGIDVTMHRIIVIVCASLATAAAVCVSGVIGWIGLVVPHMGRMLVGNDNNKLIPLSFALGAGFLLIVDNASRLVSGGEMPLSILTSLIGGPFFIYLLKKTKGREWQ